MGSKKATFDFTLGIYNDLHQWNSDFGIGIAVVFKTIVLLCIYSLIPIWGPVTLLGKWVRERRGG